MYDIYVIEEVVSKLPLTAVSISAIAEKDELLIGTRAGHLICCSNSKGANPNSYVYQLCRTFEKGVILEICVVETHNIIVCLTEAHLSMHEAIDPFRLIGSLARFKPIPCFACHVEQKEIFFVVSTKNRLIIFKKMEQDFEQMASIDLSESALRIIWSNSNSLFIAVKSEFQFAKLSFLQKQVPNSAKVVTSIDITEYPKVLFSTGQRANETIPSLIVELSDQKLVGLCRDDKVVDFFCAESGSMARDNSCRFSDSLLDLAYDAPYLVGLLPTNTVEMRSISPPLLVQKITLPKVSMLSVGSRGLVYAASETQAWKLNGLARVAEIFKQLKEEKQFELALQLANSHQQLRSQLVDLKRQMAADCFNQRKFTKCFDLHAELNTDVLFVVNLFPNFMPEKYKALIAQLQTKEFQLYDVSREMLPEKEQKSAIQALNQYLSVKRNQHSKPISLHYLDYKEGQTENILPVNELKRHEASLELIDTILLKCYLQVNPTLVGSLLRVKNCCCIISEAEKDLKEHKMFDELLILYERKKMHRKYLELLTREIKAQGPGGGDIGVEKIVSFLMTLKRDQMPLILEFSTAVLAVDMKRGVQIFTGDGSEHNSDAKNFDRDTILQFLKKDHPEAVIPYLEHIINMWKDERPKFHEELLFQYISYIRAMLTDFLKSMAGTNPIKNPIGDKLTMMKKKLKFFLENDQHYTVKDALKLIELDENLIEERAILCGRMGQHTEALNIYTNILMDFRGAERHCQLYASEKNPLFYNLFHYYISADPNESKNANKSNAIQRRQNITEALKLLRRHATNINIVSAFALIPSETSLSRLTDALKAVFESLNNRMTSVKLLLSLTNIAIKRTETHLKHLTQQRIHINERVECCLCKKRIMQSAFVRHRNSSISHFFCYKSNQERRP